MTNSFLEKFKPVLDSVNNNPEYRLPSKYNETLYAETIQMTTILDREIQNISAISKIDDELQLKQNLIDFITSLKEVIHSALPFISNIYSKGKNNSTGGEQTIIKGFIIKAQELKLAQATLLANMEAFKTQYKIQD